MKKNKIRQQEFLMKTTSEQVEQDLQTPLQTFPVEICETAASLSQSQSLKSLNAISQANTDGIGNNSIAQNVGNINCNQLRAGDWVCLLCNNLNFSFRSECNRCLVQTKKKNFFQNMMLVQDGQTSQQHIDDNNLDLPSIPSQHQEDSQSQIDLTGNVTQHDEPKLLETPLKYERYVASKAGCGFENVLLLLTPHRNNIHSDDDAEHRVSAATTAPLSSHSGSDHDQPNDAKLYQKGMLPDSNLNRMQVPFEEDDEIFGRDHHSKIASTQATTLQFSSSPADLKEKRTGAVGEQVNKGESLIEQNNNSKSGQFQLFGQATTQFPHFMSSPSSMHDDDEELEDENQKQTNELRQFDNEESDCSNGSFQNEIQQQINNIIMDEEECKNTGITHNDNKHEATFRLTSASLNPNDKPSFSFGGSFGRVHGHVQNKINHSGQAFSDSQRNICQSLNFNQACQGAQQNNNSIGGVDFSNYSQYLISNHFNNSHSTSQHSIQGSQLAYQTTQQSFLGIKPTQKQSQASEDYFVNSNGIRETKQMSNFQQQSQNFNRQQQQITLSDQLLSNNSQNYQSNLFKDHSNNEDSLKNNVNLFDDGSSNTFLPIRSSNNNSNVFSKLAQVDNFYLQENYLNQNTINFEQASLFAGKVHQIEEMSPEENDGFTENDNDEEQNEQIQNNGVKSAKKSNNIRKKPKNQTSDNKKKVNKLTLSLHQHHSFQNNSLQQPNLLTRVKLNPSACSQPIPDIIAVKDSESLSYLGQYQSCSQVNSNNQPQNPKKQDWICPRCANLNYSFRKLCNKCQFAKNNFAIHIPHHSQKQ